MSSSSKIQSHIIQKLTPEDVALLSRELNNSGGDWKNHYERLGNFVGPLAHGKTKYIFALNIFTKHIVEDNRINYQETIKIICKITGHHESQLGRTYWHKLQPGEYIDCHRDIDVGDSAYFSHIKRYHFYPNIEEGFIVIIDSTLWGLDQGKDISQALIFFNHAEWHYYNNHSKNDVAFLVIDFLKN